MGNFMSSITNIKDEGKISWTQVLILGLVPLGQLYARVKLFNGSLDKWWLMFPLLLFPPFSFIPLIMMKYGSVANGAGGDPLDNFILIPIIAKFIIPFILPFIIDEDSTLLFTIVGFIIQLLTVMTANLIRRKNNCNDITINSVGKASIDSTISIAMGDLTSFAIGFVPVIGTIISILQAIPFIGNFISSIVWSIGFAGAYCIINMFNQHPNLQQFCSTSFTGNLQDKMPFFVSLAIIIGVNTLNSISIF